MSVIEKMLIKGIRSFSPENEVVLEFKQPLTIIVGQNGAGKTTIIECLKMATTGSLPPNTRSGQSFIHDPKLANETEVKAQIKLRFRTANRTRYTAIRSFQLTQNKTKLQYKAVDQVLQYRNEELGKNEAQSYRCIDMDRIVPQFMGVSKAILENVIFVHQEESNWPLDEGSVLKKKFDDIFSATKYTKALEALVKIKKEHNLSVRIMKVEADTLKSHMDQALRHRKQITVAESRIAELQEVITDINSQIGSIAEERDAVDAKLTQIADIGEEAALVQSKLGMKQQQSAAVLDELGCEPEESLQELEVMMQEVQVSLDTAGQMQSGLLEALGQRTATLDAARQQQRGEVERHGRLKGAAEAHAIRLSERDSLVRRMADQTQMMAIPSEGALSFEVVDIFSSHVRQKAEDLARELSTCRAGNRSADEAASEKLSRLEADISSSEQALSSKSERKSRLEAQLTKLEAEAARIVMSDEMLKEREEDLASCEARLADAQHQLDQAAYGQKLQTSGERLGEIARAVSRLREERKSAEAAGESETRLKIKRREMNEVTAKAEQLMGTRKRDLLKFVGASELPDTSALRLMVEGVLKKHRNTAERQRKAQQEAHSKMATCQAARDSSASQLHKTETQCQKLLGEVLDGLDQDNRSRLEAGAKLEALIADRRSAKDKAQKERVTLAATHGVLEMYMSEAKETNCCSICQRPFCDAQERNETIAKQRQGLKGMSLVAEGRVVAQEALMRDLPSKIETKKGQEARADSALKAITKLQPKYLRYENSQSELPELRAKASLDEANLKAAMAKVEEADEQHKEAQELLTLGTTLLNDVAVGVDSLAAQAAQCRDEIARLDRQRGASQQTRSVADVDSELEVLEKKRDNLQRERDEVGAKQATANKNISSLTTMLFAAREELQRAQTLRKDKEKLNDQAEDTESEVVALAEELNEMKAKQAPLEEARRTTSLERDQLRKKARQEEETAEKKTQEFKDMSIDLQRLNEPIKEYITTGQADQVEKSAVKISNLEKHIESLEEAAKEAEAKLRSKEEDVLKRKDMQRQLKDAIQFLKLRQEEDKFKAQEAKLMRDMVAVGDQATLMEERNRLQERISELGEKRDMNKGSISTEKTSVIDAQQHLREPQYNNIDDRCRTHQVKLKTTEMAINDLTKYHKALEKALLMFHSKKMEDINKIIKELWQKTYRNQDIDYIMVKSDADGARSYNYRVVMVCQDSELDMRGRCSAGQKVLACLIIRMALAETFCLNCGILALDEPTTNLDAANSGSLADALRHLMEDRHTQENFQMVIITHDERFANQLGASSYVDHMWRVTKDENQHTHLSKESIKE